MDEKEKKIGPNITSKKGLRVKSYFLQAAKEIIQKEGVENVSVRRVADLAGYSYATIYNYFADLNGLLAEVKNEMIQDMIAHMNQFERDGEYGPEDIKMLNRSYIKYYIDHPNIYRFFYLFRIPNGAGPGEVLNFDEKWHSTYRGFVERGVIQEEDIMTVAKTIIYGIQGLLTLYFSDNGMTEEMVYRDMDQITEYLLKGRNSS